MVRLRTRWPLRYGVAVLAVAGAVGAMRLPVIGPGLGIILFLAVLIGSWFGGLGPGLLATALIESIAVALGVLSGTPFTPPQVANLVLFLGGGVMVTLIVEALRAARSRAEETGRWLTAVLSSIGDAVIATDARGRVTFTNPVARALTGWGDPEAQGQPLDRVFALLDEATREPAESPVGRVLREGAVVGLEDQTILVDRAGIERPTSHSVAPIRDESGQMQGVVLVFRDATEARRREAELRASEERFRFTADHAPVLIWLAAPDGRRTWFNKPWLDFVGRPMGRELGDGWAENIHPDDSEVCLGTYRSAVAARRAYTMDHRLRRHDGEYRWVVASGVPLRDPGGEFTGFIGSCIDITDRRLAEERLRESDRRKDEFLAMLAHELRNPLSAISNAVSQADAANWDPWTRGVLERQVRHLARLIDDLLDVARVNRGKIRLRKQRIDLGPVLESAVEAVRPLVEGRRHRLEVSAASEGLHVEGDPTRLEQVVVNLLVNAAKYTDSGGRIELTAAREGGEAVVRVRDTGVGLTTEALVEVFRPFIQGDRTLARSEGGLGIGLTLVKGLVELHGGSVTASSEGPGRGSEFTVRLPSAESARPVSPAAPPPARASRGPSRKVLVVDDNVDSAQGLARLLGRLGHDVAVAHDGREALESARGGRPEFILLDIGLPGMDGYEVARHLRAAEDGSAAVLIAISGYGQEEDRRRSREAGIDHHLVKPVDHGALLELLARGRSAGQPAPR